MKIAQQFFVCLNGFPPHCRRKYERSSELDLFHGGNHSVDLLKTDVKKLYRGYLVPSLSAAIVTSLLMGVAFALIGVLFPVQITAFFIDATTEILEIAPRIICVYFLSFLPMGINIQATCYLQVAMRTTASNTLSLLRSLVFSGFWSICSRCSGGLTAYGGQ